MLLRTFIPRLLLAAFVIGAAIATYALWPHRKRVVAPLGLANGAPIFANETGRRWYFESLPRLEAESFVAVADREALTRTVRGWVQRRAAGPSIDEDLLTDAITTFLYAWTAPSADILLQRHAPYRKLRTDIYADPNLHQAHRFLVGTPLAQDTDPAALLELLFRSAPDAAGRPVAIATSAELQVATSRTMMAARAASDREVLNATRPQFSMYVERDFNHRMGPFSVSFAWITEPSASYRSCIKAHGTALICELYCTLKSSDGRIVPVELTFFFSPDDRWWHVIGGGSYYIGHVCWPV